MTEKVILTDLDGVCLVWVPGFIRFMKDRSGLVIDADYRVYHTISDLVGCSPEEGDRLVEEFHSVSSHYLDLPPYEDALEYIPRLGDRGWRFIAITACGVSDVVVERRRRNLKAHYGDLFLDVHGVCLDGCKEEYLKKYDPTYYIDDHPRHVEASVRIGHETFHMISPLIGDPKALAVPGARPVKTWKEIYHSVLADFPG